MIWRRQKESININDQLQDHKHMLCCLTLNRSVSRIKSSKDLKGETWILFISMLSFFFWQNGDFDAWKEMWSLVWWKDSMTHEGLFIAAKREGSPEPAFKHNRWSHRLRVSSESVRDMRSSLEEQFCHKTRCFRCLWFDVYLAPEELVFGGLIVLLFHTNVVTYMFAKYRRWNLNYSLFPSISNLLAYLFQVAHSLVLSYKCRVCYHSIFLFDFLAHLIDLLKRSNMSCFDTRRLCLWNSWS